MADLQLMLRRAWRRRVALAAGIVLALLVAAFVARMGTSEQWTASARLVLDTPVSQVVDSAPKGADSLAWRAEILAALATSDPVRTQIAAESGIPFDQLTVSDPTLSLPLLPATLPRRAATVAAADATPYVLTAQTDGELPFVTLVASTPDRDSATRLVAAARAAVETTATPPAGSDRVQEIVVEQAGAIEAERQQSASAGLPRAAFAAIACFTLWCVVVLLAGPSDGGRRSRPRVAGALPGAGRSR